MPPKRCLCIVYGCREKMEEGEPGRLVTSRVFSQHREADANRAVGERAARSAQDTLQRRDEALVTAVGRMTVTERASVQSSNARREEEYMSDRTCSLVSAVSKIVDGVSNLQINVD